MLDSHKMENVLLHMLFMISFITLPLGSVFLGNKVSAYKHISTIEVRRRQQVHLVMHRTPRSIEIILKLVFAYSYLSSCAVFFYKKLYRCSLVPLQRVQHPQL